jgi:hypothetical protein
MWEMDTCEREWSDFVSYCPQLPAPLDLFIVRLHARSELELVDPILEASDQPIAMEE